MPISISEYHQGLDSEENRILSILEKQPYEAHDLEDLLPTKEEDISKILFIVKRLLGLEATLKGLIEKGLVRSKVVNGTVYYVCSRAYQ
jgi:hypothetical protein